MRSGLYTGSIQEIELGLKSRFHPKKYYIYSCFSIQKIKKAVYFGIRINIEDNLSILEQLFWELLSRLSCSKIRINPHIMDGVNYKISVAM
ncbi:hypothetical protein [Blattabacterium punctulatus]|uniref:hypothetical protein n=1 Tax=Blattabacterium punctulatus TaxID=164514 RepID=UPI001F30A42A|nr:hypothetical protein [Blattabacterium punctulatus]